VEEGGSSGRFSLRLLEKNGEKKKGQRKRERDAKKEGLSLERGKGVRTMGGTG